MTNTFAKDSCDREIVAWRARPGRGLSGDLVREMIIEAVEKRFGSVDAIPDGHRLEFLPDTGRACIARETKKMADELGLAPIRTLFCSPQGNCMADSFVNTFKRDYVGCMDRRDAQTVLSQLARVFENCNEVHSHSALKMQSPRESRRGRPDRQRPNQVAS